MREGEDNRCSVDSANLLWQRTEDCHSLDLVESLPQLCGGRARCVLSLIISAMSTLSSPRYGVAPSPGPASQFCWAILTEVDVWLVLATGSIVSQYTDTGEELQVMGETPRGVFHQHSS